MLNSAIKRVDQITDFFLLLDQTILVLETSVRAVLTRNSDLIRDLIAAAAGRVITSLLPVTDLQRALEIGHSLYNAQPLFSGDTNQYYYPLLEAVLTMDAIVIHILFSRRSLFLLMN